MKTPPKTLLNEISIAKMPQPKTPVAGLKQPLIEFFNGNDFKQALCKKAIDLAFFEDLGEAALDLTTEPLLGTNPQTKGTIYCKSSGAIIAGIPIIALVFLKLDPQAKVISLVAEGEKIKSAPVAIAQVSAQIGAILTGERIALNLLQRMCAVATKTSQFVEKAQKSGISLLDTRKTTPGLRLFEKYAVLVGGGENHRFGLNDVILIKDNHIQMAGGITKAVTLLRSQYPNKPLAVECTNLEEVKESLNLQVNRILLDNMSADLVQSAVKLINGQCFIEVSGGINLDSIDSYLQPGVNAISVGALTHSASSIDLSLEVENQS